MHTGHVISGAGHASLVAWALLAGVFTSEPLPFEVQEVSVISGAEFEAMMATDVQPETPAVVETPQAPEPEASPPVAESIPDAPPERPATPEVAVPEPQVDATPEPLPTPAPAPVPEPAPEPVEVAPPQEDVAVLLPERSPRPRPRPAQRVAPEPVAQPAPDTDTAPEITPETTPEATDTPAPDTDAAAPEEATTEIVNADETPSGAPERSLRPRPRPATRTATAAPEDSSDSSDNSALEAALAEARESGGADTPAVEPAGPPLSRGEKEALRVAVEACWIVDVGSQAAHVTVTLTMEMTEDGKVKSDTIRMIGAEGGSGTAVETAFQAARRAVLRCQRGGYNLPKDKYEHWREIEMTFNPEKMRSR